MAVSAYYSYYSFLLLLLLLLLSGHGCHRVPPPCHRGIAKKAVGPGKKPRAALPGREERKGVGFLGFLGFLGILGFLGFLCFLSLPIHIQSATTRWLHATCSQASRTSLHEGAHVPWQDSAHSDCVPQIVVGNLRLWF